MGRSAEKVDSRDISVVIQGPLYRTLAPSRGIHACISAVRAHLPHAEVVVSTWVDEDLAGVDADVLVTATDPGVLLDFNGNRHNTNRQLVSTRTGIQAASRSHVLKLRTDHILTGSDITVMGDYDSRVPLAARLLHQPITVTTLFIRNPEKVPLLFHLSDLIQFGTREDMLGFWDQELRRQEEVFAPKPYKNPIGNFVGHSAMRMTPEQCLMLGFMRKKGYDITLQTPGDISPVLVELSERLLSENFTVLDWETSGVDFPERFRKNGYSLNMIYTAAELADSGRLANNARRARYRKIWLNKYVFSIGRLAWWIALASILLTAVSPGIARSARATMRKLRRLEHPNNDRV